MYMKNYKTLYKIITLSLVFGGCLYNYNMHNVYASDLNIVDEKGDNYLVNSGGTFRNFPPLLSHVCPAALSFDGYHFAKVG